MITIKEDMCQGCGLCIEICPKKILALDESKINDRGHTPVMVTDENLCTGCTLCAVMCPDCVIELE